MNAKDYLAPAPWDTAVFDMPCFEIKKLNEEVCRWVSQHEGHYTIKINPLDDKTLLHDYGFYYTDTLIEPSCDIQRVQSYRHPDIRLVQSPDIEELLPMCVHSFLHGRFHRDFGLSEKDADRRYQQWLKQLHAEGHVMALTYQHEMAAFIAYSGGQFLLHAVAEKFRGRGLAKYFWSLGIDYLLSQGEKHIQSSISASNLAVLNLYVSLGFRFENPVDIYHKITRMA